MNEANPDLMITKENIEAVVAFLPALELIPKGEEAHWADSGKSPDGTPVLSLEPDYHPDVRALIRAFYDNNFVQPFDWSGWQHEAKEFFNNPELLHKVDLDTCCKLITLHVRKDRFSGGHFGLMVETGHIAAIVRRLRELTTKP